MQRKMILFVILLIAIVMLGLLRYSSNAQAQADSSRAVSTTVGRGFSYQGYLEKNGTPYSGTCDMKFALHEQLFTNIQFVDAVAVTNGVFDVLLNEDYEFGDPNLIFNGQEMTLEIEVKCAGEATYTALSPHVTLPAVPYAHGLRPGVIISGTTPYSFLTLRSGNSLAVNLDVAGGYYGVSVSDSSNDGVYVTDAGRHGVHVDSAFIDGLHVESAANGVFIESVGGNGVRVNSASTGVYVESVTGYGLYVESANNDGVYVKSAGDEGVYANSIGAGSYGGYFINSAPTANGAGYGVYARGNHGDSADLILGANDGTASGDNGVISSDPAHASSDIALVSMDKAWIVLDDDADVTDAYFGVFNHTANLSDRILKLEEDGDLFIDGTLTQNARGAGRNAESTAVYGTTSTASRFESFGSAQLVDGDATVQLAADFATLVDTSSYHIFLTPYGDCPLYIAERTSTNFTVRAAADAKCTIAFDYRIIGERIDFEPQPIMTTEGEQ